MISKTLFFFGLSLLLVPATYVIPVDGPKVYVAAYKNDAEGAYTLIHDDFGGDWAQGIEQYADTMAYNRSIPFCFALITGQCDGNDWKKANEMILHGHQVLNHSMHHKCGREYEWCTAGLWDEHDFNIEIDSSTNLINSKTNQHPAFFMFPFDIYTDTMIGYLRDKGYAGARAGNNSALQSPDIADPLRLNYKAFLPENSLKDLNSFAFQAMEKKSWAIREVHGVNDGSWGKISLEDYKAHMDYLQSLSRSDSLWVATLSDVLMYQMLRKKYSVTSSIAEGKDRISQINFTARDFKKSDSLVYATAMATSKMRRLTIVLVQDRWKLTQVRQNGKKIPFRKKGEKILIEADPADGALSLAYK
jgi:hypothetical protein